MCLASSVLLREKRLAALTKLSSLVHIPSPPKHHQITEQAPRHLLNIPKAAETLPCTSTLPLTALTKLQMRQIVFMSSKSKLLLVNVRKSCFPGLQYANSRELFPVQISFVDPNGVAKKAMLELHAWETELVLNRLQLFVQVYADEFLNTYKQSPVYHVIVDSFFRWKENRVSSET